MIHETHEIKARLAQFKAGDRVQILPHHDLFMRGARYGQVVKVGRSKLTIRTDVNGVSYTMSPFGAEVIS